MAEVIHSHSDTSVQRKRHPFKVPRRTLLMIVAFVVFVGAVAGGIQLYRNHRAKQRKEAAAKFTSVIRKADTTPLYQRGDAIKLLDDQYKNTTDPAQQYAIAVRIGSQYYAQKDWKNALKWFETAQKTSAKGSESVSLYVAESAENSGDKQKAIEAYKQYISLLEKQPGPYAQTQVEQYKAKVKALGG